MFERLIIGIALVGVASTSAFAAVVVPTPGPIVGAGIPGLIAGGVALYAWYRNRKAS